MKKYPAKSKPPVSPGMTVDEVGFFIAFYFTKREKYVDFRIKAEYHTITENIQQNHRNKTAEVQK